MSQFERILWRDLLPRSPVFTTAEAASVAEVTRSTVSRSLSLLAKVGVITRVRRGLWAAHRQPDFSPLHVVPHLFRTGAAGYVSLLSALNLHGMIEQIPRMIHVVTTTQRPRLVTPVGTYEFHQIHRDLFGGFGFYRGAGSFDIATPAKALFDTLYLAARKGRRFSSLPEVLLPEGFAVAEMESWIWKIGHLPIRVGVEHRWRELELKSLLDEVT
jgi:predicted transcriptional regulator of viral defense system